MAKPKKPGSNAPFLPEGLAALLEARDVPRVDAKRVAAIVKKKSGTPHPKWGAFIPSAENVRRYGFALPKPVRALLDRRRRLMIEDAKTADFKYVRVGGAHFPTCSSAKPKLSPTAKARAKLRPEAAKLRKAKWTKKYSKADLV
jgi:hypothetical protein